MPTIFLRAVVLYGVLIITMRAMGKRQLGEFQPYEFVMAMLIANLIATPMSEVSVPLLHGLMPMAALYVTHAAIKLLCMRSDRLRSLLSGRASVLIANGVIQRDELKRLCLTLSDLLEGLREAGILDPAQAETAIMEADGTITAFPGAANRPANAGEAGVATEPDGLPMALVMDGRVQPHNLQTIGRDEAWLRGLLQAHGLAAKSVLYCQLDPQDRVTIQDMDGALYRFPAGAPGKEGG